MKLFWILILILNIFYIEAEDSGSTEDDSNESAAHNAEVAENRIAAVMAEVIEHYKQEDPIGFPGADIPDPLDVPNIKKSFGLMNLVMTDIKAYGCSKFRITKIQADLNLMKVDAVIVVDEIIMKGKYQLSSILSKANGPFTVFLKKVKAQGVATLTVTRDGQLQTDSIKLDISFGDLLMNLENLGFMGSVFQNVINNAHTLVFDTIKPFMLGEADTKLRAEINKNIKGLMKDTRLPNSITPLDMAIALGRKKVRQMGYDPYRFPNYNRTTGIFSVYLENTWVSGLSSFYRVGEIVISMENNTLQLTFDIGTQKLCGGAQWQLSCGLVSRYGQLQFTIDHFKAKITVQQPLDTTKRLQINDLQLELGNIQVRCKGAGTMDYAMEFFVNIIPNLLRYQIMDALENPIKIRVQEKFNTIDVEAALKNSVQQLQSGNITIPFEFKL